MQDFSCFACLFLVLVNMVERVVGLLRASDRYLHRSRHLVFVEGLVHACTHAHTHARDELIAIIKLGYIPNALGNRAKTGKARRRKMKNQQKSILNSTHTLTHTQTSLFSSSFPSPCTAASANAGAKTHLQVEGQGVRFFILGYCGEL